MVVGDVLFGDVNFVGWLLVMFYMVDQMMFVFDDYIMEGCIYCYFCGILLYLFGYGLFYIWFGYGMFCFDMLWIVVDGMFNVQVEVVNIGKCVGDEVV